MSASSSCSISGMTPPAMRPATCGRPTDSGYEMQAANCYGLAPYIAELAHFETVHGKSVHEIGSVA